MSPSRLIVLSPLIALAAAIPARVHAQQPAAGRAPTPVARADRGAQPQPQPQPAPDPARMKWLLRMWEQQSSKLKTLDVHIYRIDRNYRWKDEDHFEGRAVFKSPNLAYIDFWKLKLAPDAQGQLAPVPDPKIKNAWVKEHTETIVCGANAVWQYLYDSHQIFVFPLAKGDRQRALDEGPLPFLFNMKAKDAEARYDMSLVKENEQYYLVKVLPKLQADKESFKWAFLYLEKKFLLPARIALLSPDGTGSREYRLPLDQQRPNSKVNDLIFKGGPLPGWKVQENPGADDPAKGHAGARPGAAVGGRR